MNTYQKIYGRFERDFFGCLATGVLVQSIVGGIAAMYVLTHGTHPAQMVQLFCVVAASMLYNGAVLGQLSPKTIFNMLWISLCVNTSMIALNILF